jgi:hypothetical protein
VNFFFVLLSPAKLDARAPFSHFTIQAPTLQIVGTVLDVRAEFLFHLCVHL